ncbi:MAG: YigZ family protein [Sphingobacteriales bacterium]|nr:YigZ family protein [Sphingobacteriales bacterium]
MLFDTEYKTITLVSEGLFKEKGSKFIAFCKPIYSIEDFKEWLNELKILHPSAVHHCYAYRIGYDKSQYRMNDDGEPSGSAGKPIYNVILSNDLTNIGIIIVRYFGGSLLGVPGLISAYKQASVDAIALNNIITRDIVEKVSIQFPYEKMNVVMRIVKEHQLKIIQQESDLDYTMYLELPIKNADRIRSAFELNFLVVNYISTY